MMASGDDGTVQGSAVTQQQPSPDAQQSPPQTANEPFGLSWPGKQAAWNEAEHVRPVRADPPLGAALASPHVYIEGDNLDALALLRPHLAAHASLIYLDPPYNTGNAFVYSDRYAEAPSSATPETRDASRGARTHAAWLSMMAPRLLLGRELLREDGVMALSIDDHESPYLRLLCDEIFGGENFVATICHKARGSVSNDKVISTNHHYVHLYAKDASALAARRHSIGLDPDPTGFDAEDERGRYKLVPVDGPGGARKGNPFYEFQGIEGYFRYSRERMQQLWEAGEIVRLKGSLQRKRYWSEVSQRRRTDTTWWDEAGYTSTATVHLKKLLGGAYFESPKPVSLLARLVTLFAPSDGGLVVDYFSGSGTTGHAVMQVNAADGGSRRCVLVQEPAPTPEGSPAREAGLRTIPEIARQRLLAAAAELSGEQTSTQLFAWVRVVPTQ